MTAPKNGTIIKIGFGTLATLFFVILAWFINLQSDTNKYFQSRVDLMIDRSRYENDHLELSSRMQQIDKYIDGKFTKYEEVMHKRMTNMETRADNKFRDMNEQLRSIQVTLNRIALNQTRNEKIACQEN
jgi:hypothetical protein